MMYRAVLEDGNTIVVRAFHKEGALTLLRGVQPDIRVESIYPVLPWEVSFCRMEMFEREIFTGTPGSIPPGEPTGFFGCVMPVFAQTELEAISMVRGGYEGDKNSGRDYCRCAPKSTAFFSDEEYHTPEAREYRRRMGEYWNPKDEI